MPHHHDEIVIPRPMLFAAGALVAVSIVAASASVLFGSADKPSPKTPAVAEAALLFEDRPEGVVAVLDAQSGRSLIEYGENEAAFIRVVMRGVARQRRMRGEGPETPVVLSRHEDGQIWLHDPASDMRFYLDAFGRDNAGAFAEILEREAEILSASREGEPQ